MTKQQKISVMLQLAAIGKMLREDRQTQKETFENWTEDFIQFESGVNEFKGEK
jgi:hypothetical protein